MLENISYSLMYINEKKCNRFEVEETFLNPLAESTKTNKQSLIANTVLNDEMVNVFLKIRNKTELLYKHFCSTLY